MDVKLSNGLASKELLVEQNIYKSFYSDQIVYSKAGRAACLLLDFALSRSGSEGIVETFYSIVRSQQLDGGQNNDTLQRRAKLAWMLPNVGTTECEQVLTRAAKLFYKGDGANLRAHRGPFFTDPRSKKYNVSKVVDRKKESAGRCPYVGANNLNI